MEAPNPVESQRPVDMPQSQRMVRNEANLIANHMTTIGAKQTETKEKHATPELGHVHTSPMRIKLIVQSGVCDRSVRAKMGTPDSCEKDNDTLAHSCK